MPNDLADLEFYLLRFHGSVFANLSDGFWYRRECRHLQTVREGRASECGGGSVVHRLDRSRRALEPYELTQHFFHAYSQGPAFFLIQGFQSVVQFLKRIILEQRLSFIRKHQSMNAPILFIANAP